MKKLSVNEIKDESVYLQMILDDILLFEGFEAGVYDDEVKDKDKEKVGTGKLTIGYGFNIEDEDVLKTVLKLTLGIDENNDDIVQEFLKISQSKALTTEQQQTELSRLISRETNGVVSDFILSEPQSIQILEALRDKHINLVDSKLSLQDLPYSRERALLVALSYNTPSLLGDNLVTAIKQGNRARAWVEIRYRSNKIDPEHRQSMAA